MRTTVMAPGLILCFALMLGTSAAFGQSDTHIDTCELMPSLCTIIGSDHHEGFCDNISNSGSAHDFDCRDFNEPGPRQWQTYCTNEVPGCIASATVYCPGLGTGNYVGKDWISFICSTEGIGAVKSGVLGQTSQGPVKGVMCGNNISCGCSVNSSAQTSTFFGNRQWIGENSYSCHSM